MSSRTILTPASGYLYGFTHTLNPYMGCTFGDRGCGIYCYVAESPIGRFGGERWGTWVKAKGNAADVLIRDIRRIRDHSLVRVFMSSATDPYQPVEAKLRITRAVLEVLAEHPIGLLVIQTRSPLVERDFDLLESLPFVWLSMTVETNDDDVRRALTPTCASIQRRLSTMRSARERGIKVQAAVSPMLPTNTARFAELLSSAADRVVIDTFLGDGANGKRTARRPLAQRFVELGFGDWRDQRQAQELHDLLASSIGADRVGWSDLGFNSLPSSVSLSQ